MRTRTHVSPEITEDTSGDIWCSLTLYIFEQEGCNLNEMSDEPLSKGGCGARRTAVGLLQNILMSSHAKLISH